MFSTNHKMANNLEKKEVMEQMTRELKKSGYDRAEAREIIVCGLIGWKRKITRREKERKFYRNAKSKLPTRCRKKDTEKTSWYKKRRREEDQEEGENGKETRERIGKRRKVEENRRQPQTSLR